jgi:hypothetical protein
MEVLTMIIHKIKVHGFEREEEVNLKVKNILFIGELNMHKLLD